MGELLLLVADRLTPSFQDYWSGSLKMISHLQKPLKQLKKRKLQLSTFLVSGYRKLFPDNLTRMEMGKKMKIKCHYLSIQLERNTQRSCYYPVNTQCTKDVRGDDWGAHPDLMLGICCCHKLPQPPLFQMCPPMPRKWLAGKEADFMASIQMKDLRKETSKGNIFSAINTPIYAMLIGSLVSPMKLLVKSSLFTNAFSANGFFVMKLRDCCALLELSQSNYEDCP